MNSPQPIAAVVTVWAREYATLALAGECEPDFVRAYERHTGLLACGLIHWEGRYLIAAVSLDDSIEHDLPWGTGIPVNVPREAIEGPIEDAARLLADAM